MIINASYTQADFINNNLQFTLAWLCKRLEVAEAGVIDWKYACVVIYLHCSMT